MKTTYLVLIATLMATGVANAQILEYIQLAKGAYDLLKTKADKDKISELQPTLGTWAKLQQAYVIEFNKAGDCKEIGFTLPKSTNFSYECGKKGKGKNIAFLQAKTKNNIGDCPAGATFEAKFDSQKGYFETSLEPIKTACVFFEAPTLTPEQKKAAENEVKQRQAAAIALNKQSETGIKTPSAKDIDINGSRSKAEIMGIVNANMPGLKNIYNKYLKLKSNFSGKVTLKFTVVPSGDIASISIISSTTGYNEFDNSIKDMVATWKLKPVEKGNATITIPFDINSNLGSTQVSSAKEVKQEQYPCRDSQNRILYCNWNSGCYAIDPRYADPPGGTCNSHIENCKKWGALFVGVKQEGAGIHCSNVGGTAVSK